MADPAASGIFKQIRLDAESTYGVAPVDTDTNAIILRRVSCDINPQIATFKSAELRPDRQLVTFRHGTQQIRGTLRGELSPVSYAPLIASLLAGAFTTGAVSTVTASANTLTYAAAVVNTSPGTITRTSGSWITDGLKQGDVIQISGSSVTANNARNYRITGLTDLVMSVGPTPTTAAPSVGNEVVAAGTDTTGSVLFTVMGQKLVTPDPFAASPGTLLDPSFTLEQYFPDQSLYELYTGCKASEIRLGITPSALATIDVTFMGQKYATDSGQYFTAAQAPATTEARSGVVGLVRVADIDIGLMTNLQLTIAGGHTVDAVLGTPFVPFVFPGIIDINGTMSILFYDETYFNLAVNETEVDLSVLLTDNDAINSDFLSFGMSRIKLNSVTKDDGPKAIIGTYSFQALKQVNGGVTTALDNTTLTVQDSLLS